VEIVLLEIERCQLSIGDLDSGWVLAAIKFGANRQARSCRGVGDQIDDHFVTDQGPPTVGVTVELRLTRTIDTSSDRFTEEVTLSDERAAPDSPDRSIVVAENNCIKGQGACYDAGYFQTCEYTLDSVDPAKRKLKCTGTTVDGSLRCSRAALRQVDCTIKRIMPFGPLTI
jgi:hypothetical protein